MNSNQIFTPQTRAMTPRSNPEILKYIAYGMVCAAVVLISLGVYFYQQEDKFLNSCKLITVKITNIEEKRLGKPMVTFADQSGKYKPLTMLMEYDASDEEFNYKEGDIHELYYYEADPAQSQLKGFFENHLTSFILIIIGIVFMMDFPILLMVSNKTIKKQQPSSQFGIKDDVIVG